MVPGPSEPDPEVLAVLSQPILPHYGGKWKAMYADTNSKLQKVFKTNEDVIILPVPGQLAVEMAVTNLVRKGDEAYVCVNGYFSGMILEMIEKAGGKPVEIKSRLGTGFTPEQVASVIEKNKKPEGKVLFLVQNETSTGAATNPADIFKVCKKNGMVTVLDSISAFGGIDVRVDEWNADFTIGYASKCIGGIFGAQPIAIRKEAWEIAKKRKESIHSRFLNLNVWREAIERDGSWGHPFPSSMPTSVILALRKAVDMALAEGLENRYRRHAAVAKMMRDGFEELDLEVFPDKKYYSDTVSVASTESWESKLRARLVSEYDIMIAGGLGPLKGKIIRIGHMGTSARPQPVALTLAAIGKLLKELRHS
jgi:alanine-glyoxylate transaminase/serine-glyoxylate transaminase/serine-pyruvate transaminase